MDLLIVTPVKSLYCIISSFWYKSPLINLPFKTILAIFEHFSLYVNFRIILLDAPLSEKKLIGLSVRIKFIPLKNIKYLPHVKH